MKEKKTKNKAKKKQLIKPVFGNIRIGDGKEYDPKDPENKKHLYFITH